MARVGFSSIWSGLLLLLLLTIPGTVAAQQSVGVRLSINLLSLTEQADPTGNNITVTATLRGETRTEATVVTLALATSRPTSPFLLPGLTLATQGTDYTTTLSSSNNTITIASGDTSATTTFTIDPTLDTAVEADETIIVSGSGTNLDVLPTELMLTDGPYLTFATPLDAQVLYRGADLTSSSITLPSATSPLSGTVTYQVTSDPATPANGLTHTQPGDKLSPGTLSGTLASTNSTTRYTITATHAGTTPAATATARVSVSVIEDQCSTTTDDWKGSITTPGAGLIKDCNILLAAKDTLRGTGGGTLDWATDKDITTWKGLSSVEAGGVKNVSLNASSLKGSIPPILGGLAILEQLNLTSNQLTGAIPWELGALANLEGVWLYVNKLSGQIPSALGALQNLLYLNLSTNSFTHIPPALGELKKLTTLAIGNNPLTGAIPWELGRLTELTTTLQLDYNPDRSGSGRNQLTGPIPRSLGRLTKLKQLYLHSNQLSGPIPPELGNLTKLERLYLWDNQLSGAIPPELGKLTKVQRLYLWSNQLSGAIPPELGNLTALEHLRLGGNQLSGAIPSELGNLTNLTWLLLRNNALSGAIPSELGSLTGLVILYLSGNQLEDPLPATFTSLTGLKAFSFDYNESVCLPDNLDDEWYDTLSFYSATYQDTVEVHCAFDPPAVPTAAAPNSTSLTVNWDAYSATGFTTSLYQVQYRAGTTGKWRPVPHDTSHPTSATTYTLTALTPGRSYQVRYRALDDIASTDPTRYTGTKWSAASATVDVPAATFTPGNLTTTGVTLTLDKWPHEWWYQGNQTDAACTKVDADTSGTSTVPLSGLTPNTSYTYTAYKADDCASANEIVTVTFRTSGGGTGGGGGGGVSPPVDRHGNTPETATPVSVERRQTARRGTRASGQINTRTDVDYFRLSVPQAGWLVVETTGSTNTQGTLWEAEALLTETEALQTGGLHLLTQAASHVEPLAQDDDSGTRQNFRIPLRVTPGDYLLAVTGSSVGAYTLRSTLVAGWLDNPQPASHQSGISVLSGWLCTADSVVFEVNDTLELEAAYGTERPDTADQCDETDTGFGLLFNWNRLGAGEHTVTLEVDGNRLETFPITVTTLGEEFLAGATGETTVMDFPTEGESVRLVWQEARQNFALASGEGGGTGTHRDPDRAFLENPQPGSYQSGVSVLSGWACEAETVVLEVDGALLLPAGYGTERTDTVGKCEDTDNGFGVLFNWNRLDDGEHTVRLLIDGEEWATATFTVTTLGEEFRRGLTGRYTLTDFPSPGEAVTVEWQEAQQNFVMTGVGE